MSSATQADRLPSSSFCTFCSASFSSSLELSNHLVSCHVTVPCPRCNKEISRSRLRRHLKLHQQQPGAASRHVCAHPGCGTSFSTTSNLKAHVLSRHLNARPFPCPMHRECGLSFAAKQTMQRHFANVHGSAVGLGEKDGRPERAEVSDAAVGSGAEDGGDEQGGGECEDEVGAGRENCGGGGGARCARDEIEEGGDEGEEQEDIRLGGQVQEDGREGGEEHEVARCRGGRVRRGCSKGNRSTGLHGEEASDVQPKTGRKRTAALAFAELVLGNRNAPSHQGQEEPV